MWVEKNAQSIKIKFKCIQCIRTVFFYVVNKFKYICVELFVGVHHQQKIEFFLKKEKMVGDFLTKFIEKKECADSRLLQKNHTGIA